MIIVHDGSAVPDTTPTKMINDKHYALIKTKLGTYRVAFAEIILLYEMIK